VRKTTGTGIKALGETLANETEGGRPKMLKASAAKREPRRRGPLRPDLDFLSVSQRFADQMLAESSIATHLSFPRKPQTPPGQRWA
jgi:hypothetical protein